MLVRAAHLSSVPYGLTQAIFNEIQTAWSSFTITPKRLSRRAVASSIEIGLPGSVVSFAAIVPRGAAAGQRPQDNVCRSAAAGGMLGDSCGL